MKKKPVPGQWVQADRQADGSREEQVGSGTVCLSAVQHRARRERRSEPLHQTDAHTHEHKVSAQYRMYYFTCIRLTALVCVWGGLIHSFCKHDLAV